MLIENCKRCGKRTIVEQVNFKVVVNGKETKDRFVYLCKVCQLTLTNSRKEIDKFTENL